jgi:hypothetical protein
LDATEVDIVCVCCSVLQVEALTAEVASLKEQRGLQPGGATAGMQEQLNQMALSMDKRHTRVETAIYQVRTACNCLRAPVLC